MSGTAGAVRAAEDLRDDDPGKTELQTKTQARTDPRGETWR